MRYVPPVGAAGDASYSNGNRSAGVKGSVPPAAAIEHPMRELAHLIAWSGQTGNAEDLEQVRKAIDLMIDAKIGGAPADVYFTMAQARARIRFFPEIENADATIIVTSPEPGVVVVPAGVSVSHRSCYPMSTGDFDLPSRTFATAPSRTYHLRMDMTGGGALALKDLADGVYNPTVLAESSDAFDSGYDDMLFARVVTNAANVPAVTNLINKGDLLHVARGAGTVNRSPNWTPLAGSAVTLNWARTPVLADPSLEYIKSWAGGPDADGSYSDASDGLLGSIGLRNPASGVTRYGTADLDYAYEDSKANNGYLRYHRAFLAR